MLAIQSHLRNKFLAGIFAAIPLAVTGFVIWYVESATRTVTQSLFGVDVPFLGIGIALAVIYLLGLVVTSLLGGMILRLVDWMLSRIPLLRELYRAWKQIALTPGGGEGIFAKVALMPSECGRGKIMGFWSGQPLQGEPTMTCVFVPAAPNPTAGRLYLIPIADIQPTDLSPEEAFKFILSGGNYIPPLKLTAEVCQ